MIGGTDSFLIPSIFLKHPGLDITKLHSSAVVNNYLLSPVLPSSPDCSAKFPQWIANHKFIPIQVFIMQILGFENGILATT